jgi:predicted Ser/Thr protein kinase
MATLTSVPTQPPVRIGKYEVTDKLGEGAMGVVYRALDPILNRHVAIKLMSAGTASDDQLRERFLREARAAGSLQHPNIITIFDFGDADDHLFIAMEYVEGADLQDIITRRDPIPLHAKLAIMTDVLRALEYAHGKGIVHRDVKPANIRVSVDGRARLMDFGIARMQEGTHLTQSGMLVGTPHYMAPEQITGGIATPATDVFSVGGVLFEFLGYAKAFEGQTLHEVLYRIVSEPHARLSDTAHGIPDTLESIITRALEKDPARRYASAGMMAHDLEAVQLAISGDRRPASIFARKTPLLTQAGTRSPLRRRRLLMTAGGAVVLLLAAATAWSMLRGGSAGGAPHNPPAATAAAPPGIEAPPAARPAVNPPREEAATAAPARTQQTAAPAATRPAPQRPADTRPAPDQGAETPAPAPANATPEPVPVAPAQPAPTEAPAPAPQAVPALPEPRAAIAQLVAQYAAAIELRSIAAIRRSYPGLTAAQQQGWENFYGVVRNLSVQLAVSRLELSDARAEGMVSGAYNYTNTSTGLTERQPVNFRATFARDGAEWRITSLR